MSGLGMTEPCDIPFFQTPLYGAFGTFGNSGQFCTTDSIIILYCTDNSIFLRVILRAILRVNLHYLRVILNAVTVFII